MAKRGPDDARVQSTCAPDDIGELRKYIVEMMRVEMELLETIKSKEHSVTGTNARIKNVKELITQEYRRYKTLIHDLEDDAKELGKLEEKRIGAQEKHRRFRDAVAQQERDVHGLRDRFQHQRAAMLSLRCQLLNATTRLEALSSMDDSVERETRSVTTAINEWSEPISQRAARQKICVELKQTQQVTTQMQYETSALVEKRTQIEAELSARGLEAHNLRERIVVKENEAEALMERLRKNTRCVIQETDKITGKLKTKRRKYRAKVKNEISSLKRRISFITSELEKCQMTNEDMLSHIGAVGAKREELETRLSARDQQLAAEESVIAELSTALATATSVKAELDTKCLQEKLAAKQRAVEAAQRKLHEKQNLLKMLEEDQTQVNATLESIDAQILGAKDAAVALDGKISALAKDLDVREMKRQSLSASVKKAEKQNEDLQAQIQERQRVNKSIAKKQASLRRQKASLLKQKHERTSELRQAENLRRVLAEGIKYGTQHVRELSTANTHDDDQHRGIAVELRRQELLLQEQWAQEERELQAKVMAWDDKIKRVEQELCIEV
ncbi:unnamed protein product [Hyaloperonospora brassicae]|uniref:DUF4201 domain-containing protein n=1 Tax=Hyaloperonospora brassicae TaxID=162125 RepID=A0AAV0ULR2_HYABA|nr:unnamed protein product [Hyaloperonospora brassicae]